MTSSRDRSLLQLLDPNDLLPGHTTADLYSLRHFTLRGGLPDSPSWLRAQAWKVLLGYLPPEKKEWSSTLAKRRKEYYQFLNDLSPPKPSTNEQVGPSDITNNDRLLDQIYKDLVRSRKNGFAFYQAPPRASASCPVVPLPFDNAESPTESSTTHAPSVKRLSSMDNLLLRLAAISHEYGQQLSLERIASTSTSMRSSDPPQVLHVQTSSDLFSQQRLTASNTFPDILDDSIKSPPIMLSPPSPGGMGPSGMSRESSQHSFASANEALGSVSDQVHDTVSPKTAANATQVNGHSIAAAEQLSIPVQRNWHSLLRILYLFAVLNPSISYVQGMNEALFTLLYVFGSAQYPPPASATLTPSNSLQGISAASDGSLEKEWDNDLDLADLTTHAEADAFWCFSALIGEMRELYDFDRVEQQSRAGAAAPPIGQPSHSGMAGALRRFSLRIKWLDASLWRDLQAASLDPRLPYYSLRWLACLLSTELSLPSVLRIWDALLAEQENVGVSGSAKIEFLIDVCASMILQIKDRLPSSKDGIDVESEGFSFGMRVLQDYPDDDISPVMESATLIRQRRLAADLTGDRPPEDDDDEDSNPRLAAVKARAAQAWRDWTNPKPSTVASPRLNDEVEPEPPTTKGGWLVSRARARPSLSATDDADTSFASSADGEVSDTSTVSKRSFSGLLAKYAEAVQSSDAAANLSKASTNLTAKAMARFGDRAGRESTPDASSPTQFQYGSLGRGYPASPTGSVQSTSESRYASLGSIGVGFFNRTRRTASESHSDAADVTSPRTPDMSRWSRDVMPDFPLPNVADSPAGRMEYIDTFGKRISMAVNGRSAVSPSSSVTGEDRERRRSTSGISSFPLPSMRAAAKMGILPQRYREESASPGRSGGPKPLLLSQAARPPREGSNGHGSLGVDEPSRKVSSGPMAQSMSRGNSHDSRSSAAGSYTARSSRSASIAESQRSSNAEFAETFMPGLTEPGTLPPLPSLTGQSPAVAYPLHSKDGHRPVAGLVSKDGAISAGAFARATRPTDADHARPEFGQVASSSDVPLVLAASPSIARPRASNKKRTSSSTVESRTASTSGSMRDNQMSNRSSQTTSNIGLDEDENESADSAKWKMAEAAAMQDEPVSMVSPMRDGSPEQQAPELVRKYTLTDEPVSIATSAPALESRRSSSGSGIVCSKRYTKNRQNSASSSRRSIKETAPPSSSIPLPEVAEQFDTYPHGGMQNKAPHQDDGLGIRDLSIKDGDASPRPSTDRSNFF